MRQLVALVRAIHVRNTKKEYYRSKFMASLHRAEIPSLNEVLGVQSEEEETSNFDKETDAFLERRAFEMLKEKRTNGR